MSSGFDHFILYGQKEGRNASVLYDDTYYLSHNADVAAAVKSSKDALTGIEQYVKTGLSEGKAGSIEFNPSYYVENSPGLKAAKFNNQQAAEHFAGYGIDEGRQASSAFDVQFYLNNNPDLKAAGFTYQQAFQHYITTGFKEFRYIRPGIVPAGSTGGKILVALNVTNSTKTNSFPSINPRLNTTQPGSNFTAPSVVGTVISAYPFGEEDAEVPKTPWSASGNDVFLPIKNNSNYATTKFVISNTNSNNPKFKELNLANSKFDVLGSTSDLFESITYDSVTDTITFDVGDKPGILPGATWDYVIRFTIPEDMLNNGYQNNSALTFTPVK